MSASANKNNSRVTIRKTEGVADPVMPVLRKFLWVGVIAALAWYSTANWGGEMRAQLSDLWQLLVRFIAE